ncbi:MAG: hypothetical protein ACI4OD_04315, partial [Selenomonas sp.]
LETLLILNFHPHLRVKSQLNSIPSVAKRAFFCKAPSQRELSAKLTEGVSEVGRIKVYEEACEGRIHQSFAGFLTFHRFRAILKERCGGKIAWER